MTAAVSVPTRLAPSVGWQLGEGHPLPSRVVEDIDRVYLLAPLSMLSGTGLFERPEGEIAYFESWRWEPVVDWVEADIARRREEQRREVRALVLEGLRGREMR